MADEQYDPSAHTVDEVNDYLADNPDQSSAVLTAEEDGKARTGILEGPHATPADDGTTETKGETFQEAAANATEASGEAYEKGYFGYVPSKDGDDPQDLSVAGVIKAAEAHAKALKNQDA